jgi:hypothetical protein
VPPITVTISLVLSFCFFFLICGIHPNPGPSAPSDPNFNFMWFNINGIQNSSAKLYNFLTTNSIMVACIQETKLSARSKPPTFPDYVFIRCARPVGSGGGLAILVHHSVPYVDINTSRFTNQDASLELLAVCIEIGGSKLDVFNVYIPPVSSSPAGHRPNFTALLNFPNNDCLFLGGFNTHLAYWYSPHDPADPRGDLLASAINNSSLCSLNTNSSTRFPFNSLPNSSPDVSIAPAHLLPSLTWSTHTQLNYDHLPITISFRTTDLPPRTRRT